MFLEDPRLAQNLAQAESGASFGILGPDLDLGSKKGPLGPKTKKMRAEKPCRTPPPEFQMEPYGQNCGPKPFWSLVLKTLFNQGPGGADGAPLEHKAYLEFGFFFSLTGMGGIFCFFYP